MPLPTRYASRAADAVAGRSVRDPPCRTASCRRVEPTPEPPVVVRGRRGRRMHAGRAVTVPATERLPAAHRANPDPPTCMQRPTRSPGRGVRCLNRGLDDEHPGGGTRTSSIIPSDFFLGVRVGGSSFARSHFFWVVHRRRSPFFRLRVLFFLWIRCVTDRHCVLDVATLHGGRIRLGSRSPIQDPSRVRSAVAVRRVIPWRQARIYTHIPLRPSSA